MKSSQATLLRGQQDMTYMEFTLRGQDRILFTIPLSVRLPNMSPKLPPMDHGKLG